MLSKHVEEQIIQNYLMGFTRDEIAKITNVAAGSVSNKINEWKKRAEIPSVDEIRQITTLIRKSGINVRQCAKGFRLLQSLKKFNLLAENEDVDSDLNDLSLFVNGIYLKCKEYGIGPNIITAWIIDLLNFTINNYQYLYKGNTKTSPGTLSAIVNQIDINILVPSVSLISDFIELKKKELEQLLLNEKNVRNIIKKLEEQIEELRGEAASLKQDKESILIFYKTFTLLENMLKNDCDIDLRQDLESFSKLFSDFKDNGYDVKSIVNQYNKAIKLVWDIKFSENQIQAFNTQLSGLEKNVRAYQSLLDMHRINWDLYKKLETMKFGIDELQQLWLTVSEIIKNHSDPLKDFDRIENPVAFFINDVEENYHDKLKFEDRVKAKREEASMLNFQVNAGRQNLLSQPVIGSTLLSLIQNGITEKDIIEMSHLFRESQTLPDLLSDHPRDEKVQSDSTVNNKDEKGWKKLWEELKKYGGLKAAVKEQNEQLQKIKREYSSLVFQTQTLVIICQNLIHFISFVQSTVTNYHHCKEAIDAHYREMYTLRFKNNLILIMFIVSSFLEDDKGREDNTENDKDSIDHFEET